MIPGDPFVLQEMSVFPRGPGGSGQDGRLGLQDAPPSTQKCSLGKCCRTRTSPSSPGGVQGHENKDSPPSLEDPGPNGRPSRPPKEQDPYPTPTPGSGLPRTRTSWGRGARAERPSSALSSSCRGPAMSSLPRGGPRPSPGAAPGTRALQGTAWGGDALPAPLSQGGGWGHPTVAQVPPGLDRTPRGAPAAPPQLSPCRQLSSIPSSSSRNSPILQPLGRKGESPSAVISAARSSAPAHDGGPFSSHPPPPTGTRRPMSQGSPPARILRPWVPTAHPPQDLCSFRKERRAQLDPSGTQGCRARPPAPHLSGVEVR